MRLLVALFVAFLTLPHTVAAQGQSRGGQIVVTGEASVAVAPDTALIRVGVANDAKSAREASEGNAKLMAPVIAALKEAGIAEGDIQTAHLSIQPMQEPQRQGPPRGTIFRASNQVTAKIRDIGRVAEVIDRALAAGANEVLGVSFVVDDPSPVLDRIRGEALANAHRKAEIYAKAVGAGVGRAVNIEEDGGVRGPMPMQAMRAGTAPVMPGEQTLQIGVSVSYELLY
jgi:uncharacterized protein YggE